MPDNPVRIEFLKKLHLFYGLTDAELAAVAEGLLEQTFADGETVFTEGALADSLHIIMDGRVHVTHLVNKSPVRLASLSKGDYYGEQGLLRNKTRDTTVTAEQGTLVLILSRAVLARLIKKFPAIRQNFELMMSSRQLARELNYDWLIENEIIYFLGRKHPFLLILDMILPAVLLIPLLGVLGLAYLWSSASIGLIGGFLVVCDLAWEAWRILDWGNDYYIVTNQRVIWLEKVIAFYDSRTEASMGNILSVNYETELLGRLLDFGTVFVRTYTGQIRMNFIRQPRKVVALIEEFLSRTKEMGRKVDEETMKASIRTRLGFTKPGALPADSAPPPPAPAAAPRPVRSAKPVKPAASLADLWKNAFRMRTEDGDVITYHKHIFGFFRDTFIYGLAILLLFASVAAWPFMFDLPLPLWVGMLIIFVVIVLFGIILYQYLDWQNDIYQVTAEQIIDVSRKPLGTEDRKAAPLENILSTENKRNGIIGMLFNFGTVYIMVGSSEFNFDDVSDPPSVQQDIIRRQQGLLQKKREKENSAERDRMTEWLAMYHRTVDDVNREKDQFTPPNPE